MRILAITFCFTFFAACTADSYMGARCEKQGLTKGSAEYNSCVDREARKNRRDVNRYCCGGP